MRRILNSLAVLFLTVSSASAFDTAPRLVLMSMLTLDAQPTRTGPLTLIPTRADDQISGNVRRVTTVRTRIDGRTEMLDSTTVTTYTAEGWQLTRDVTSANGRVLDLSHYRYDQAGNVVASTERDTAGHVVRTTTYEVRPNGYIKTTDGHGVEPDVFVLQDAAGRMVRVEFDGQIPVVETHTYSGDRLTATSVDGDGLHIATTCTEGECRTIAGFGAEGNPFATGPTTTVFVNSQPDPSGNPQVVNEYLETTVDGKVKLTPAAVEHIRYEYN